MKRFNIKSTTGITLLSLFLVMGCNSILEEEPRSIYTPADFNTQKGITSGITALYEQLRYVYGNGYYYAGMQSGTDESTWGQNVNTDARNADFTGVGNLSSQNNPYAAIWGLWPGVNTANGVIENGEAIGVSPALIAEARFFRGFYYFLLVQTFGGVPLDLGSGELKFNTKESSFSIRNTVPEVYTKAIFPDLLQAINDLPETSRFTGTTNKTLARLYLAKAYLTYGWWLQNPAGIPTYPAPDAPREDPDGLEADDYFQMAYDVATTAINNHPASVGLLNYYYDIHRGSNDRNIEMLLYADHTQANNIYNGHDVNEFGPGSPPGNFAPWIATWNYTEVRSQFVLGEAFSANSVQREAVQAHGRPWTGVAPTHELVQNVFADKTNDSRYDGTFTTVYRGNWQRAGGTTYGTLSQVFNANGMTVSMGQPILTLLDTDPGTITYPTGAGSSNVGGGTIAGRADWVIAPPRFSRIVYPGLWKLGPFRTDNGTGLGQANARYTRPFPVAKFSELYFIAAEAAVKGATTLGGQDARELINVIRARAGKWRWDNNDNVDRVEDNSVAMTDATPAVIDIDYILDERSREYYGEGFRWFDLVRTQTWHTRAASYTICGTAKGDPTPVVYNRTIPLTAYLRPIPQRQLDAMVMTAEEKAAYQNPGYN